MQLQTGSLLEHLESGAEAAYKAAIPTLGHGLIHLLVGPSGYLLKFGHELEEEFNVPSSGPIHVEDPLQGITSQDVKELLGLLRSKGGATANATQAVETTEESDLSKVAPTAEEATQKPAAPAQAGKSAIAL